MCGLGDLCGVFTGVHGCQGFQDKHLPGTLGIPTGPWDLQALQGSRILRGLVGPPLITVGSGGSLWDLGVSCGSSWWSMVVLAFRMNTSQLHFGSLQALGAFPMGIRDSYGVWGDQVDHSGVLRGSGRSCKSTWWSMVMLASKMNVSQLCWESLQALVTFPAGIKDSYGVWVDQVDYCGVLRGPCGIHGDPMDHHGDIGHHGEHLPGTLGSLEALGVFPVGIRDA